ncbi:MAG: PHP domain-containing protein, partial [Anaerolineae bacterium]|nr:PHP domain-containing protein [Anaerolineae bacterium]
ESVQSVLLSGDTRTSLILDAGLQVDVRAVPAESYGAALCYFTGSKAHGIALRDRALKRGLKLNEYGLYRGAERIAGETEEGLYAALELDYVPPELREDHGEIEAAGRRRLPALVALEDMRGDLQAHTQASDGRDSLEAMAAAAEARGYEYLAITDHSQYVGITHGLDAERLLRQIEAIDRLNAQSCNLTLLKGIEVDIREDGSLALPDDVLARLDIVVCAVHTRLGLPEDEQTERVLRAIQNPHCHILAHPTTRLIGKRAPIQVDMARILEAARRHGCALEINADPSRLDLDGAHCRMAKEAGVKLVISTDAHRETGLQYMRLGVGQARRGWLEAADVLNTLPLAELRAALRKGNR